MHVYTRSNISYVSLNQKRIMNACIKKRNGEFILRMEREKVRASGINSNVKPTLSRWLDYLNSSGPF